MTVSELQKNCCIDDSAMLEFVEAHPRQVISEEIAIPVWKITYQYTTKRNNSKTAIKYVILEENCWDLIDAEFAKYIEENNEKYPEKAISNVRILETEFLGKAFLDLK